MSPHGKNKGGEVRGVAESEDKVLSANARQAEGKTRREKYRHASSNDVVASAIEEFFRHLGMSDGSPKVLIDNECKVLWQSPNAARLLRAPMPVSIADGRLRANGEYGGNGWATFLENLDEAGHRHLVTGKAPDNWALLRCWARRFGDQRLIFMKCVISWPFQDVASSGLAADFGLTRTECIVLDEFARLRKPEQIAEKLKVSLSTVRSHLKQIHTKMAVNSNIQLLRIIRAYTDT